jgi:hypothetical protein
MDLLPEEQQTRCFEMRLRVLAKSMTVLVETQVILHSPNHRPISLS